MKSKIKLAVIFYGDKSQRPVNQQQFEGLKKSLTSFSLRKYNFDKKEQARLIQDYKSGKIDIVLKNAYGRGNEADLEIFLEANNIPFLGSDSKATLSGTSKFLSKKIFRKHGLPIANDIYVNEISWKKSRQKILSFVKNKLYYPCIVKDTAGTDSRGIYLVASEQELIKVLSKIVKKYTGVIIEEFINQAIETTCLVVGNKKAQAYEPAEIIKEKAFLSPSDKDRGAMQIKIPANLSSKLIKYVKKAAVGAHQALNCRTFSRVDILIKNRKLYILEVDVHPGFRLTSPTLMSAGLVSESPDQLFLKFYNLEKNL